jgi:hypothetical protein
MLVKIRSKKFYLLGFNATWSVVTKLRYVPEDQTRRNHWFVAVT